MQIPYEVKPREDTGLYNAKLGIWLFLASEVMLFGGLFSGYLFLRLGAAPGEWPHGLQNVPLGTLNTAVLIFSSVTVLMSWAYAKLGEYGKFKLFMGLTLVCSLIFMVIKGIEYNSKFHHYGVFMKEGNVEILGHLENEDEFIAYEKKLSKLKDELFENNSQKRKLNRQLAWAKEGSEKETRLTEEVAAVDAKLTELRAERDATKMPTLFMIPDEKQPWDLYVDADKKYGKYGDAVKTFDFPGVTQTDRVDHGQKILEINPEYVFRCSAFYPKYNSYFAIYFTMTALHGLHVVGGALVLAYSFGLFNFLGMGRGSNLYKTNRAHFVNRIEVGGLFWHLVDLIWIFLFPIMYLF